MEAISLRDLAELVGIASVVGGLLLVAYEVRQANRIARAQSVMELSSAYNQINTSRFSDPDVAALVMLLEDPSDSHLTPVDVSRMTGLAYQLHNILWSAQTAFNNGLLSREDLDIYRNDLAVFLQYWPGIVPHLVDIYETQPGKRDAYVFEPLAELVARQEFEGPEIEEGQHP